MITESVSHTVYYWGLLSADYPPPPPWSLNQFIRLPFQLHGQHTALQPLRHDELIVHIAIFDLPGPHLHMSQVKHVPCQRTQTSKQCPHIERGQA